MLGKTTNPELQQVEQAVQSKVPPELAGAFQRIVTAGLKIMYAPEMREKLQAQLSQQGDPAEVAGEGVAKLFGLMYQQSKGTMPMKAAVPACQVLLCEALDFMQQAGMVQVSPDVIANATKALMAYLLQVAGFSKDKIEQYMSAGAAAQGGQDAPDDAASGAAPAVPAKPAGIIASAKGGM